MQNNTFTGDVTFNPPSTKEDVCTTEALKIQLLTAQNKELNGELRNEKAENSKLNQLITKLASSGERHD